MSNNKGKIKKGTKRKYKLFADPGHGWLKVELNELARLEITDKITGYSYMRSGFAYLEEDCDYSTFAKAKKEIDGIEIEVTEKHGNKDSAVRSYSGYRALDSTGLSFYALVAAAMRARFPSDHVKIAKHLYDMGLGWVEHYDLGIEVPEGLREEDVARGVVS